MSNQPKIKLKLALLMSSMCLGVYHADIVQADSARLLNTANSHYYQRFDLVKSWESAGKACAATRGYLATITSQEENDWVVASKLYSSPSGYNYFWLGGSYSEADKTWVWDTGEAWGYTNWTAGYPGSSQEPLAVAKNGKWISYNRNNSLPYVCEWNLPTDKVDAPVDVKTEGFSGVLAVDCENTATDQIVSFKKKAGAILDCKAAGLKINSGDAVSVKVTGATAPFVTHYYELNTSCGGWFTCKATAEGLGGHLATFSSKEEQAFVYSKFKIAADFWIGLSDFITEGTFQWVNDEPLAYANWDAGEPNNKGGAEDCTAISSNGKWIDSSCDKTLPALIEYE